MNDDDINKRFIRNLATLILEYLPTISAATITYLTLSAAITGEIADYPTSRGEHIKHISGFIRLALKFLLTLCASYYLGFCNLHRAQITYVYSFYFVRLFNRYYGLGDATTPLLWITGVVGFLMLSYIAVKIAKKKYGRYSKSTKLQDSHAYKHWNVVMGHLRKKRNK